MNAYYFEPKKSLVIAAENDTDENFLKMIDTLIKEKKALMKLGVDESDKAYGIIFKEVVPEGESAQAEFGTTTDGE